MRIAILGAGMMANLVMETIKELGFSYVAVLGRKGAEEKVKALCRDNGLDGYFLDYEELLNSDVDIVYVALPNHLHYEFARKALMRGKHVIIEKPMAANEQQFKDLARTAEIKGVMLFEAMNVHYLPAYRALKEQLWQVGDLKIVSFNYSQYSSRYDAFKNGQILPAFDPMKAGGALMDLNVYNIHGIVGLFGKPWEVKYEANIERGIDTSGILTLDYGDFKAVAIGAKDCRAPVRCTIQGTNGCFVIPKPISQMEGYDLMLNDRGTVEYRTEDAKNRLYYEFMEFQRIIREKDWEKEKEMLGISGIVSEILEEARRQNGIFTRFPVMLPVVSGI